MKSSQELFELIEDYLSGALSGEQLKIFKKELKMNKALAKEVAFHEEMASLFEENSEEAAFRNNLQRISTKNKKPAPNLKIETGLPPNKNLWWLLLFLLPLAWLLFNLNEDSTPKAEPANLPDFEIPVNEGSDPEIKNISPSQESEQPSKQRTLPETPSEKKPAPIKFADKPTSSESSLIADASDYSTNDNWEIFIENKVRNEDDFELKIENKQPNVLLKNSDSAAEFLFSGIFSGSPELLGMADFKVHIFSNKTADFENFLPLFSHSLVLKRVPEGYRFDVRKSVLLPSGLYYYLLEETASEEFLFVEKFEIRN